MNPWAKSTLQQTNEHIYMISDYILEQRVAELSGPNFSFIVSQLDKNNNKSTKMF